MSMSRLRARLQAAVYGQPGSARLSDEATWNGVRVTVMVADPDQVVGFGEGEFIMPSMLIRVPRDQVSEPAQGDTVVIGGVIDGEFVPGDSYTVSAAPRLNAAHEWVCEAVAA